MGLTLTRELNPRAPDPTREFLTPNGTRGRRGQEGAENRHDPGQGLTVTSPGATENVINPELAFGKTRADCVTLRSMTSGEARQLFATHASALAYLDVEDQQGDRAIGSAFHVGEGVFVTARHVLERR